MTLTLRDGDPKHKVFLVPFSGLFEKTKEKNRCEVGREQMAKQKTKFFRSDRTDIIFRGKTRQKQQKSLKKVKSRIV